MVSSSDAPSRTGGPVPRREVLQAALAAGVGLALHAPGALAYSGSEPLITRKIPSTGERLPVIGIGTNKFAVSAPEAVAARREVIEWLPRLGGKLIDTATQYGNAEIVIGDAVKALGNRHELFIATKTPMFGTFPAAKVVEHSLSRLQVSHIDLMQVHNFVRFDEMFPVLLEAKKAGKVRYVGVTTSFPGQHPQMLAALKNHPLDFIQVDYSIADRTAEHVLHVARDKGVAVLANVPMGGRMSSLFPLVKGKPLPPFAKEIDVSSWAQLFLKYVISNPAITATIPGTTTLAHLKDNLQGGRGRLPDAAMRKRMEAYWATIS